MKTLLPRSLCSGLAMILALSGVCITHAQEPEKAKPRDLHVLFIGNSQIYYNDLPRVVEALAESAPADRPRIRADRFVAGGASLERLWNAGDGKGTARAKILEKKWDYVILQDIYFVKPDSFKKYATLFHEAIRKNSSRTLLFCTASINSQYPKGFQELHEMHIALSRELQVPVAAAGKAWLSHWGEAPTEEARLALYHADKAHPGVKGSYLSACTLYAALTGQTPVGLTHRIPKQPEDTVTATQVRRFQEVAWGVHQDINRAEPSSGGQARDKRVILASASYGKNIVALCDAEGKLLWSHKTSGPKSGHAGHHDLQFLDNGNILYHDNWTTIIEMTLDRKVVWTYDASKMNGNQGKAVEVHAFQRLPNGLTMIAESGVGRIIEVDKDGKIQTEIKLQPGGRKNTRMARKLPNGNYLVCAENPGVVTEYNGRSKVVWEYPIKTRVYGAIRLKNGNTLIASGSGSSVVEVSPEGKVVWEIKDALPDARITLKWTTFLTELDNGNILVGNCHAGEKNPQLFEITREKKVVWQFNQYATFGNGLACSQVLTDQQSALVRKQLAKMEGK